MMDQERARTLAALMTIVVTLALVVLDALDPATTVLTPQRLQLLLAFIGLLLGAGGLSKRLGGLNISFGKQEDDDDG